MDIILKSFVYRDNLTQAGVRFSLFLILLLVGISQVTDFNGKKLLNGSGEKFDCEKKAHNVSFR